MVYIRYANAELADEYKDNIKEKSWSKYKIWDIQVIEMNSRKPGSRIYD
jgi:hypothetical protein